MMDSTWLDQTTSWFEANNFRLLLSLAVFFFFILIRRIFGPKIQDSVDASRLNQQAATTAGNLVLVVSSLFCGVALLLVWGVHVQSVLLIGTSVITLLGVALFANWSILSSVTAFVILLIHPSYRRGNYVRIINLDNYYEGYISEINLFHTRLITDEREVFLYPNNALLSAPVVINPRQHWQSTGKLQQSPVVPDQTPADGELSPAIEK